MTMLKFPSPCGDYGSYHIRLKKEYGEKLIGFPSPCGDYGSYRGIYMCVIAVYEFPSPCGDYGSYQVNLHFGENFIFTFPSPCGNYGSYLLLNLLFT